MTLEQVAEALFWGFPVLCVALGFIAGRMR